MNIEFRDRETTQYLLEQLPIEINVFFYGPNYVRLIISNPVKKSTTNPMYMGFVALQLTLKRKELYCKKNVQSTVSKDAIINVK